MIPTLANCVVCGKPLNKDEKALNIKLLAVYETECFCLKHLAEEMQCTEGYLEEYAKAQRKYGCKAFTRNN